MAERYVVVVDGQSECAELMGRGRALGLALVAVDSMCCAEVVVADARTLSVRAHWRRRGPGWTVAAVAGWLN